MLMFNVRVYGLLINEHRQILLSDEKYGDFYFTKFIGGGLEFGEGTKDCLVREFKEELNLNIEVVEHFYTTDFFQESNFKKGQQIISIYYLVKTNETLTIPTSEIAHEINTTQAEMQMQRWHNIKTLNENSVTLPIDKVVVRLIKQKFNEL